MSKSIMEPSTLPAARRVRGGEEKDRVSTESDWAWREARIWPAVPALAAAAPDCLPPACFPPPGLFFAPPRFDDCVAEAFEVAERRGSPTTRIIPPAPPTTAKAPEGAMATLKRPPSTAKRWSSAVRPTSACP